MGQQEALTIGDLADDIFATMKEKGWHEEPVRVSEGLCLIHSEVSEALEEYREPHNALSEIRAGKDGKPEGFAVELADTLIRILHLSKRLDLPLEQAIRVKMAYNKTRPRRHGGKLC
jgi:NTP pyrophosphatase (non-canonical NTP hydrolase)